MRKEVLEYNKARAAAMDQLARLARKWGAESIGRTANYKVLRYGQIEPRVGKWYLVIDGEKSPATPAQERKLNLAAGKFV